LPKPAVGVGDPAPDFSSTAAGGGPVSLEMFRGKSEVVLFFYPKEVSRGRRSVRNASMKSWAKTHTRTAT